MSDITVLLNLVLVLAAAAAGGALALRLKQPIIIGYLIAGLFVGPFTPGLQADFDQFRFLTEVGLGLLLFVLGASMPPSRFRGLGGVIILGGFIQIALTIGLGLLFVVWFELNVAQGFLLGTILAQSSSAVIAKVLDDRRETGSIHGRIAVGMSVVQDISSLPLMLLLLVFLGDRASTVASFLLAIAQVVGIAAGVYVLGRLLWPRLLEWFGRIGSEELTLLVALGLALSGGLLMQMLGLSFTLGAFLAGIVIAESPQRPAAISRVLPLRDAFAAIFFVSIGALVNPRVLWQLPLALLAVLAAVIIGKALISAVTVKKFGFGTSTAILTGLLLAQIGEFSFILANIGLERGAISQQLFSAIIAAAFISIFANSLIMNSAPNMLTFLARAGRFKIPLKSPVSSLFRRRTLAASKGSKPTRQDDSP